MGRTSIAENEFATELANRGLSFERNLSDLPGSPDVIFKDEKLAIFFNGCYFHGHSCGTYAASFSWQVVQDDNKSRDRKVLKQLISMGFETIVVWECEWKNRQEETISYIFGRLNLLRILSTGA